MAKQFEGKVVLITGSSNGIGRGIAVHFAARGAKVTLTGRSEEALAETKAECVAAGASESDILSIAGNLTEEPFMSKLVNDAVAHFGKLDVLVNNAGVTDKEMSGKQPGVLTQGLDSYDYIFQINVRCVVYLCREATPHLEKTKGAIVNISSIVASDIQSANFPYYAMSKSALDSLTKSLALELIRKGIRVNGVKPGAVTSKIMERQGATREVMHQVETALSSRFDMIPVGFFGKPEDIAHITGFLSDSVQSRYIIGQSIRVDGGSSLVCPLLLGDVLEKK
ncbi:unnamed protein product, partial [Mesorhabditis spiculigera]